MDLWQLHIFCKVIELKSFSLAAKVVHLSQPTVSSHIKDLEDHFGCRLIDRLARSAVPTKAGELLYQYARKMIALRDETEAALAEFQGNIKGRLVIGGSTIPGVYILPSLVGGFVEQYPDVRLSLSISDTDQILADIVSGNLEAGIVGAAAADRNLQQEKLLADELCLVVPPRHRWADRDRIDIEALLAEPFIIRESGSGTLKSFAESLVRRGRAIEELKVIAEMGSTAAVIQGVKSGIGLSVISRIAVAEELTAGRLHALAITGLDLNRHFYLTTHKYRSGSPAARAFIRYLRSTFNTG